MIEDNPFNFKDRMKNAYRAYQLAYERDPIIKDLVDIIIKTENCSKLTILDNGDFMKQYTDDQKSILNDSKLILEERKKYLLKTCLEECGLGHLKIYDLASNSSAVAP